MMQLKHFITLLISILLLSCNSKHYKNIDVSNPEFIPNTIFLSSEDLSSPKFEHLITKYQLDTIFHGETDELKRILLLRHWEKSVIKIDNFGPYSDDGFTERILDAALNGEGFHCGHFMKVQNGIMNAYGYVTRTLGAGSGQMGGPDGHHGINEIWLNSYNKWFLSDAKYDHHFEKEGIPLSALEIRDEYLKNKGADILLVDGLERIPFEIDKETGITKERYTKTYTWLEWHGYNNMFTVWPDFETLLIMYEDEYFSNRTWIWDGKPHWAYNTKYLILEKNRIPFEWTPNTISSKVTISGNKATIILKSDTPNLREYQILKSGTNIWQSTNDTLEIFLENKKHELFLRTINIANITGPEHKIVIEQTD